MDKFFNSKEKTLFILKGPTALLTTPCGSFQERLLEKYSGSYFAVLSSDNFAAQRGELLSIFSLLVIPFPFPF